MRGEATHLGQVDVQRLPEQLAPLLPTQHRPNKNTKTEETMSKDMDGIPDQKPGRTIFSTAAAASSSASNCTNPNPFVALSLKFFATCTDFSGPNGMNAANKISSVTWSSRPPTNSVVFRDAIFLGAPDLWPSALRIFFGGAPLRIDLTVYQKRFPKTQVTFLNIVPPSLGQWCTNWASRNAPRSSRRARRSGNAR